MCGLALLAVASGSGAADSLTESLDYLSEQVHQRYLQQHLLAPELPSYLATLFATVRSLFPHTPLRLYLMRLADGNASALPDGGIYLRQGFLAQIHQSEELIFVLAHEAAHVALEHVASRCHDDPRLGSFPVDAETEADREALRRMREAGIATAGIRDFLTRLASPGAAPDSELSVRIERLAPQAAAEPRPPPGPLLAVQKESLDLLLSLDRDRAVTEYLRALGHRLASVERLSIQAELARRSDQRDRAEALFRDAIEAAPLTGAAWRGLALTLEAGGRREAARETWQRVLELEPGALDAPLIRAFIAQSCAPPERPATNGEATSPLSELRAPPPWRIARRGPAGFVASPDSVELTRVRIEPEGPPLDCPISMVLLERVLRQQRGRPGGPALTLETAAATAAGALARLSYRDEDGIGWRLDLYAISSVSGQFEARFSAPTRYFYPRWAADATAIIRSVALRSPGTAAP